MDIPIVFENEHILVVNKPSGLVVTPGPKHPFEETLAGWLREREGPDIEGVGQADRWGIVHRLDKDTSGIMVVVKTSLAYKEIRQQFKEREIFKVYWVLAWGNPEEDEFIIDAPLGRNPENFMRVVVIEDGKRSVTKCKCLQKEITLPEMEEEFSLIACQPVTGRTHQIRVHLKALGHPLFGDPLYSGRRKSRRTEDFLSRTFIHAKRLGFRLPERNQWKEFEVDLAWDLKELLQRTEQL